MAEGRKRRKKDEEEDVEVEQVEEQVEEGDEESETDAEMSDEELEQEVEDKTGSSGLSIRVGDDQIEIDLPRDGNEDKNLKALAQLVKGMN